MNSLNFIVPASEGFIQSFRADRLNVQVYESTELTEIAVATALAVEIRRLIIERGRAVGIFSGEISQAGLLRQIVNAEGIEWTRVIAFHTAELLGVDEDHPQSQRKILLDNLVMKVPMAEFHGIRGEAANPEAVCANYAALLASRQPDFATLEIGASGELAAIDAGEKMSMGVLPEPDSMKTPSVNQSAAVKLTGSAIALADKTLMACPSLFVIASGEEKRRAVQSVIESAISESCPASILRTHPNAHLFLDKAAAANLTPFI